MGSVGLSDILVTPLARIATDGGDVMHALKKNDPEYGGFGEAYFSWLEHRKVKAWKCHTEMTMNLIVPFGQVKFVFCDLDSQPEVFRIEEIGDYNYARLTVPPGVWFGFQGLKVNPSLVLNIADIPHDPREVRRLSEPEINYNWS